MATNHQVLCINKSNRYNSHERITHIGGVNSDGGNGELLKNRQLKE